jgi:mannose-6-phosphate isomerase class I
MYKSNYDKYPFVTVQGNIWTGWDPIVNQLQQEIAGKPKTNFIMAIECYQGVNHNELIYGFKQIPHELFINTNEVFYSDEDIVKLTYPDVTDDDIFGYMTRLNMIDFLDKKKVALLRNEMLNAGGLIIVYGYGASLVVENIDLLIYADMPRWEIQMRQRRNEVNNIGINNRDESAAAQYKRGYFVDWRVCDRLKKTLFDKADYWLDTVKAGYPKMIRRETLIDGLESTVKKPFRVVPFFDPGPWGGQWMKKVCDLDLQADNYAWCFDCVPEENSLLFKISETLFEIPSINLVFYKSSELLGEPVESRFGQEFPIRFDFLDTMEGGNLSLQVHPLTQYIRDQFGMNYTQDESYYILDAGHDANVFLGLKEGINSDEMVNELKDALNDGSNFNVDKYINKFPAKKHDHFLIPNGTIHCSGADSMVLEISATPYIFTFKLWDWDRLGLDGKPRPINIQHGTNVIQWNRDTDYCINNLVNQVQKVSEGDGWIEERTGLHKNEFIETRRHWFTGKVEHNTSGGVNVLNLVEGREAIIESPDSKFEPFVVHYAETFIIPAAVSSYTIRPYGESEGKQCATIKAYVRFKQ